MGLEEAKLSRACAGGEIPVEVQKLEELSWASEGRSAHREQGNRIGRAGTEEQPGWDRKYQESLTCYVGYLLL